MEVYAALTHRIAEWWSLDFQGRSSNVGDVFTVHFGPTYKRMRLVEVQSPSYVEFPPKRVCAAFHILLITSLIQRTGLIGAIM